jgi:DNA-binding NarL/FixJ family response regulator
MLIVTRVVLVDDHALFRKGMRALLSPMEDIEVVGEAQSGPEAISACQESNPDLVLLDLQMLGGGVWKRYPAYARPHPMPRFWS